jgi:hypothetical protein
MLNAFAKAAAKFAKLFATPYAPRPSRDWRRVYGDGAPRFTIE